MAYRYIFLLFAMLQASPILASPNKVLLKMCNNTIAQNFIGTDPDIYLCIGYFYGVMDSSGLACNALNVGEKYSGGNDSVTWDVVRKQIASSAYSHDVKDIIRAFVHWGNEAKSEDLEYSVANNLIDWLTPKWPCQSTE